MGQKPPVLTESDVTDDDDNHVYLFEESSQKYIKTLNQSNLGFAFTKENQISDFQPYNSTNQSKKVKEQQVPTKAEILKKKVTQ